MRESGNQVNVDLTIPFKLGNQTLKICVNWDTTKASGDVSK